VRRPRRSLRARTRTRRATSRGRAAGIWQQPTSVARRLRSRARSARPAAAAPGRGAWGGQVDRHVRDVVEPKADGPPDGRADGGGQTGGQAGGQTGGQTAERQVVTRAAGGRCSYVMCGVAIRAPGERRVS